MLEPFFTETAKRQMRAFCTDDRRTAKLKALIADACAHPFTGLGKPEPLKHRLQGHWSRRIDAKNRLAYRVVRPDPIVISVIGHYE
jgi:toxin YoeB